MEEHVIRPIAHIRSEFPEKFGVPRQAGLVESLRARVVFTPEFRRPEALRGLEGFSHIWLIWQFSLSLRQDWSPTVRPPRLGGNARVGVFASRSPFRPNSLGLSCVELLGIEETERQGSVLLVAGADLVDGTPIFDIKPYLPYADSRPQARGGFAPTAEAPLPVRFAPGLEGRLPADKREALLGVLAQDPRPRYREAGERLYAMDFAGLRLRFRVEEGVLTVTELETEQGTEQGTQ